MTEFIPKDLRKYREVQSRTFFMHPEVKSCPDEVFIEKFKDVVLQMTKTKKEDGKKVRKLFKIREYQTKDELLKALKDFDHSIREKNKDYLNSERGQKQLLVQKVDNIKEAVEQGKTIHQEPESLQKIMKEEETLSKILTPELNLRDCIADNQNPSRNPSRNISTEVDVLPKLSLSQMFSLPDFIKYQNTKSGSTYLLCGSSKSSKSTTCLQMALIWKKKYPKTIIIMINDSWISSGGVYKPLLDEYNDDVKVVSSDKLNDAVKLISKIQTESDSKHPVLFILDDVVNSFWNQNVKKLFCTLRNKNISTIMAVQNMNMVHPSSRGSLNYIIGLRQNNTESRKKFYDNYLHGLMWNKNNFSENYARETDNYGRIFIDMLNDKVYKLVDG